jgi:hypothetical protein
MLAILGRCIKRNKFSPAKWWMWICLSSQQIDDLGILTSRNVTSSGGWHFVQTLYLLWSELSEIVGSWCTCSFASLSGLGIVCSAIVAEKCSGCVVWTKYSQGYFYFTLHLVMPRNLNTPGLLFSDCSAWYLEHEFHFRSCCVWKPSFVHYCHIHGQEHLPLFQVYATSLPCYISKHVGNTQESSCHL